MDTTSARTAETLRILAADGVALAADVALADDPVAAAVLLHPHPRFGGNRHNAVVAALFRSLPEAGITALRLDFRPDAGRADGDLDGERADALAGLDELAGRSADRPLVLVGYSFGAAVALTVDHPGVVAKVVVAPPLTMMAVEPAMSVPMLVLAAAHDQFMPAAQLEQVASGWRDTTFDTIDMADHFFVGQAATVAQRAAVWIGSAVPR